MAIRKMVPTNILARQANVMQSKSMQRPQGMIFVRRVLKLCLFQHCVVIIVSGNNAGLWNDVRCGGTDGNNDKPFICETAVSSG